ncbi:DUF4097 family beta strand repeat-containing protein [Virgibacillus kekensis]|uniref:DUF4097 family beta strand repeat-containing protein n=1 Tax=Virgibacillus kekensis TaxID=202261 RepID=A0ABV9DG79_9BACI
MSLFSLSSKMKSVYQREVINGTDVDSVRVSTVADVQLACSGADEVEVLLEGEISERIADDMEFTVEQKGSFLEINVELKKIFFISVTITDLKLHISLPEKVYNDVTIKSSSGDSIINNIASKTFTGISSSGRQILTGLTVSDQLIVKGSSGDIILNNNNAGLLMAWVSSGSINSKELSCMNNNLDATSGEIHLYNEVLEGNTECKVSSGNIRVQSESFEGNLDIRATSGNVDIFSKKFADDLQVDCHKTSGRCSVNVEGLTIKENSKNRFAGLRGKAGGSRIKADTTSGNVTIAE